MILLGLTGAAGCGKNTMASHLQKIATPIGAVFNRAVPILAFADALRDVTQAVFGSRYETQEEKAAIDPFWNTRCYDYSRAQRQELRIGNLDNVPVCLGEEPATGRRILQFVGTEMFRTMVHPDVWLMVMERKLQDSLGATIAIITDCRFDNEAQFVRDHGGFMVSIVRPDAPKLDVGTHVSEAGISPKLIDHHLTVREGLARSTAEMLYRTLVPHG